MKFRHRYLLETKYQSLANIFRINKFEIVLKFKSGADTVIFARVQVSKKINIFENKFGVLIKAKV